MLPGLKSEEAGKAIQVQSYGNSVEGVPGACHHERHSFQAQWRHLFKKLYVEDQVVVSTPFQTSSRMSSERVIMASMHITLEV